MKAFYMSTAAACMLTVLPAVSLIAQPAPSLTALDRLDALLNDIATLRSDVVQLIVESDGGVLEESEIQMMLKKPDGFYWETLTPFPELIVTNGSTLWNYQPDLEQVVIEDWDSSRSELAAQLLSGNIESSGRGLSHRGGDIGWQRASGIRAAAQGCR